MKERILGIICKSIEEINDELDNEALNQPSPETVIYGGNGNLDSIALVNLISLLEDKIYDEFDQDVVLADERAMSQRRSPFSTVGNLSIYIEKLLREESDE